MRIIYRKRTLMTICEVQLNRMYRTEPENFERVILEDDEKVMTALNVVYLKKDLEIQR
jgi:hypothetical protein